MKRSPGVPPIRSRYWRFEAWKREQEWIIEFPEATTIIAKPGWSRFRIHYVSGDGVIIGWLEYEVNGILVERVKVG